MYLLLVQTFEDIDNTLEGDTCYPCETNSQRNAVTAAIFLEHLRRSPRETDPVQLRGSSRTYNRHQRIYTIKDKKVTRALYKRIVEPVRVT